MFMRMHQDLCLLTYWSSLTSDYTTSRRSFSSWRTCRRLATCQGVCQEGASCPLPLEAGLPFPSRPIFYFCAGGQRACYSANKPQHGRALFVDGPNLGEVTKATTAQKAWWTIDIRSVLDYLHGLSPHRIWGDVKPWNVVTFSDDDRAVLVDFGRGASLGWVYALLANTCAGHARFYTARTSRLWWTPKLLLWPRLLYD